MYEQSVGENFNLEYYLEARQKAWELIHHLKEYTTEGIKKSDLEEKLQSLTQNIERWWHPTKIRLKENTICTFRDKDFSDPILKAGDVFFFDLGPVFQGHEADVGQTYCLGKDNFVNPAETLFYELKEIWQHERLTGANLYKKAFSLADKMGYEFNHKMQGHRLGDFPHALFHKGSLGDFDHNPIENLWILEVHLLNKNGKEGYFFEDLL